MSVQLWGRQYLQMERGGGGGRPCLPAAIVQISDYQSRSQREEDTDKQMVTLRFCQTMRLNNEFVGKMNNCVGYDIEPSNRAL